MSQGSKNPSALQSAINLAYRTLEYVSNDGEAPEPMLDCDVEMWNLAHTVLRETGQVIPKRQKSHAAWKRAIGKAKAKGLAA